MRLRLRLRRSPVPFWLLSVALAMFTGLTVHRLVGSAADRAARLGGLVSVPVVVRGVDAGEAVAAGDVAVRRLPRALLPRSPAARSWVGRVAVVPLIAGEVVLAAKLAPDGLAGIAALVPSGRRALAVPVDVGALPLRRGNRVDVLATFEVDAGGDPTFPVAAGALVVDAGEDAVTVAVTADEAPRVAFALARGTVALALASP